jgi:hypothetical protein
MKSSVDFYHIHMMRFFRMLLMAIFICSIITQKMESPVQKISHYAQLD